jgi:hypothetical protein
MRVIKFVAVCMLSSKENRDSKGKHIRVFERMNLTDLHKRMVRNIFLNVELLLNDDVDDLSEYDVQGLMFFYLRRALLNTTATAERERKGKVDCVVYDNGDPVLLYEMKTYYKKHEKLCSRASSRSGAWTPRESIHRVAGYPSPERSG